MKENTRSRYINKKVKTKYGEGVVVGIDLPKSHVWRLIVEITEPTPTAEKECGLFSFHKGKICVFREHVIFIKK